jgi:hypothetical protein
MRISLALIASLGLVGCVGGLESAGPTGPTADPEEDGTGGGTVDGDAAAQAKKLFEDNVHPTLQAMCVGCHSSSGPVGNVTGFVSTDLSNAYQTAVGYQAVVGSWTPDGAPILTKITGANKTASHQSINYSNDQINKITEWLNKELEARGANTGGNPGGPTGPESAGQATTRLLGEWTGCMTQANFEAADMRNWGNVGSNEGNCRTCHGLGEFGFIASNTSTNFFPTITEDKYYLLQYFAVDLSQGVAAAKIVINERSFEGVGNGLAPHQQHPNFDVQNNNGRAALQAFYNSTMAAKQAAPNGVCGPSKLKN